MGILHKLTFAPRLVKQYFYLRFNKLIFKSAGAIIGDNFKVYNRFCLKMYKGARLKIGDDFVLYSGECINPVSKNLEGCFFIDNEAEMVIGNHVGMSSPTIWCAKKIVLRNNVRIGGGVTILDTDCHSLNYLDRRIGCPDKENAKSEPVMIEEDVLIGANSIILKGSHIGARSIIGAGSVVSGFIPSDCVAAGNPCKIIRKIGTSQ